MRDFHSCKQKEGQSVSSYVPKIKGYIDNLERLGHPVTLGLVSNEEDPAKDSSSMSVVDDRTWKRNYPYTYRVAEEEKGSKAAGRWSSEVGNMYVGVLLASRGNGQCEAVEAIGKFDLSLPSG
ncbi:hypothetical protein Tco_0374251 [Tanacetum coccineum]